MLKTKLGEAEAEQLVKYVREEASNAIEEKYKIITKDIEIAKDELQLSIAKTETKLILWAFVFWATQLGAIFAFLKFFMK